MKLKLFLFALFIVIAGYGKTAAAATDDHNTAASTKVRKTKDKMRTIVPVAVKGAEAATATSNPFGPVGGACKKDRKLIEVEVVTDVWPEETRWTVTKNIEYRGASYTSNIPILSGGPYADDDSAEGKLFQHGTCAPPGQYKFTIYVSDIHAI